MTLHRIKGQLYELDTTADFERSIRPLSALAGELALPLPVRVYRVHPVLRRTEDPQQLCLFMDSAAPVERRARAPRAKAAEAEVDSQSDIVSEGDEAAIIASDVESDAVAEAEDLAAKAKLYPDSESDTGPDVASEAEAAEPAEATEIAAPPAAPASSGSRLPGGTHTESSSGYFTFTDNRNYKGVRVHIVQRWKEEMQSPSADFSKNVQVAHYDVVRHKPVRSMIVLHAWAWWRMGVGGFCAGNKARLNARDCLLYELRRRIASCDSCSSTGCDKADTAVRQWCPVAFAA